MYKRRGSILLGFRIFTCWLTLCAVVACREDDSEQGHTRVRLVLDYLPNPIHAGIYLAEDEGAFQEASLTVTITAPTSTTDTLRMVSSGRADVGLVPLMDFFQAVENGQDFVLVMALVDRPLAAVMARETAGVRRPRDLEGKLVGLTGVPSDAMTLEAMVRADGGDPERLRTVTIGFNAAQNLVAGTVDAAFGFWSYEGVLAGRSVTLHTFLPTDYGIPPYPEIVAFARREFAEKHPEALTAFRRTVVQGYSDALARPPDEALAPLARVLEGENAAELVPFWEVLRPVVPGNEGFRGELRESELQAYFEWVKAQGFLEAQQSAKRLIFSLQTAGA